ncbi:hypothetical protein [Pedobacter jeongneungensis]|nr:hypothetical protein [Pedobacter jeongneungensis]
MKTQFPTILAIANAENTTSELRASTLKRPCCLIGIPRHQV